jgi:uncharacterized protein YgiM (DUF1202 family)
MPFSKIVDFVESKLGCGYVYGATGWVCSEARRKQQADQYPEYATTIMTTCAKWDGKQCYDCAQLTKAAAKAAGASLPSGATSQWKSTAWAQKGEIATIPDKAGIFLYRQKGSVMQHTGVYIGNGRVVDSRGSSQGTIESDLGSYPWTHWAELKLPESPETTDDGSEEKVIRDAVVTKISGATGNTVNLRKNPDSSAVVLKTVPFGTVAQIVEEANDWSRFTYDGAEGWMMSKYLIGADGEDDEGESYTEEKVVTVDRAKLLAVYDALGEMLGDISRG